MNDFLSLISISSALVGGFIGAFLGGFAKFFWENWLPSQLTWRRQQNVDREKFLAHFRDPAMRATSELQDRVYALIKLPGNYQYAKEIGQEDYYILSTAFLVAQFFCWVEIIRRKAAMLDYGELVSRLDTVVEAFSSGGPGFQIFRLQQREIGERIIVAIPDQYNEYNCMGYAEFVDLMRKKKAQVPLCISQLEENINGMLANPPLDRLVRVQHALIDLMDFLDPDTKWVSKDRRSKV